MKTITLSGWNTGFNKVGLTKLLRELGYGLPEAKAMTDSVLNKEQILIDVEDGLHTTVLSKLNALGVRVAGD